MAEVTIWHNPSCGTSRNALARLREKGIEPDLYLYLQERPKKVEIEAMLKQLGMKPSELLRPKQPEGEALGLYEGASEAAILKAMTQHSILIQRPIVIGPRGAVLARPVEKLDAVV